ncbi:MAG TPA: alpha-ketoacid dehydrogenase subunit beta [Chloroflexota bacterium]|nr:alpha-ketoacid dehydrogenase subunit beta [Chloroflexota bacterium]
MPEATLMSTANLPATRQITYVMALNEALREEMRRDPTVFVMGEDVAIWGNKGGVYGVTQGLYEEFGAERVRDTPISEEGIVGTAVGAAVTGMRPVAEIMYADFMALAMDPLVNQGAKLRYMFGGKARVPLVIRTQEGAGRGIAAQHSQSLEAWFAHIPGIKVCVPSQPADAKGLLKTAIRDDNPVMFLEHKMLYATRGPVPEGEYTIPFGVADVKREGKDVTFIGIHTMVNRGLTAAEKLAAEGISVEVIDPRTLVPFDIETIVNSVKKTGRVVIAHEAYSRGGIAGEIAMQIMENAFDYLDAPIVRVAGRNVPVPYNLRLERAAVPQDEDVINALRNIVPR